MVFLSKHFCFLFGILLFMYTVSFAQKHESRPHIQRHHQEDWPESLECVTVTGEIDYYFHGLHDEYFLLGDDSTYYALGFGPPWYQPKSGAPYPQNGDMVTIRGGLCDAHKPCLIVAFVINGSVWRDSTGAPPWSGGWIHKDATDTTLIFCPTDSLDWIAYPPASIQGIAFPESIYCQIEEMSPDFPPGVSEQNMFEGYYADNFHDHGNHMHNSDRMLVFDGEVVFQFHYNESELDLRGLSEESIQVKYLDGNLQWQGLGDVDIDLEANVIFFARNQVHTYYALSASPIISVRPSEPSAILGEFMLMPNFPNPFNQATTIRYDLPKQSQVTVRIHGILGREIRTLINTTQDPGYNSVVWDGTDEFGRPVGSGVYLYQIQARLPAPGGQAGDFTQTKKMLLLR